jgi:hypothetical protein
MRGNYSTLSAELGCWFALSNPDLSVVAETNKIKNKNKSSCHIRNTEYTIHEAQEYSRGRVL